MTHAGRSSAYRVHTIDAPVVSGDAAPRLVSDTVGDVDPAFDLITDRGPVGPLLAALPQREGTVAPAAAAAVRHLYRCPFASSVKARVSTYR